MAYYLNDLSSAHGYFYRRICRCVAMVLVSISFSSAFYWNVKTYLKRHGRNSDENYCKNIIHFEVIRAGNFIFNFFLLIFFCKNVARGFPCIISCLLLAVNVLEWSFQLFNWTDRGIFNALLPFILLTFTVSSLTSFDVKKVYFDSFTQLPSCFTHHCLSYIDSSILIWKAQSSERVLNNKIHIKKTISEICWGC